MSATPRRSTRGTLFTPSPHPSPAFVQTNTTYSWTSAPLASSSSPSFTHYNSFARIVTHSGLTPRKGKARAGKQDEESRFTVGDGVMVSVEGGEEGVGVLIRLWEELEDEASERSSEEDEGLEDVEIGNDVQDEERGRKMMAEVHWCFRRQDLPGIMKNLSVEDNEVLLAASPIRPVTTQIPIRFLLRTIPIYSRSFFLSQNAPAKSSVKGWTYVRQGVYWCSRALDKYAKGGRVWRVNMDGWREDGRRGRGWRVPMESEDETESEGGTGSGSGVEFEEAGSSDDADEEGHEDAQEEHERDVDVSAVGNKRKRSAKTMHPIEAKRSKPSTSRRKVQRVAQSKSFSSHLVRSVLSPAELPVDPYQRAMRLLHVGATPESLPCREEEFVDVLSKVEEGVDSGGGGCLYIAGVPGTGKTATVHAVVKELKRKAEDGELPPFSYVEINGLKIPSPQQAYTVLWEAISGAKGCSAKTALRGLEAHFGRKTSGVRGPRGHTFVVLMDELDQLLTAKQDVVYNFFNWPTMRDSQLFVIAVANRMDLPQNLAAKIKSRLGLQTLLFQPYDRTALIEIVQSRLIPHPQSTKEHKVLLPDAIALAATKMAGTNGDARRVLDACRRAVEVAVEGRTNEPHPVTAKEMMAVLNHMSSSPVAMFVKRCSMQQKMMMAAVVRCVRREGIPEISWRAVRADHDALTRSLLESNNLSSNSELAITFSSLIATHALTWAFDIHKALDDRRVALGMEIGEVGRVLMNEGDAWRRALAGV